MSLGGMFVRSESGDLIINCGRHKGQSIKQVALIDPEYIQRLIGEWDLLPHVRAAVVEELSGNGNSQVNQLHANEPDVYDPLPENAVDSRGLLVRSEAGELMLNFGRHKGRTVNDVAADAPDYIDWIIKQPDLPADIEEPLAVELRAYNHENLSNSEVDSVEDRQRNTPPKNLGFVPLLHKHLGWLATWAAIVVGWFTLSVRGDFGLLATVVAGFITFVAVALATIIMTAIGSFASRSARLSEQRHEEIQEETDRFQWDVDDSGWQRVFELLKSALELEPTSYAVAERLGSLIDNTLEAACLQHGVERFDELPERFHWLIDYEVSGFMWQRATDEFMGVASYPTRPTTFLRRLRRFVVFDVGLNTNPTWIAASVAILLVVTSFLLPMNAAGEDGVLRLYRSTCESLGYYCGGRIEGYNRSEALESLSGALRAQNPREQSTGELITEFTCFDLASTDKVDVAIDGDESFFKITWGHVEKVADPGGEYKEFLPWSHWKVAPPSSQQPNWSYELVYAFLDDEFYCDI